MQEKTYTLGKIILSKILIMANGKKTNCICLCMCVLVHVCMCVCVYTYLCLSHQDLSILRHRIHHSCSVLCS